MWDVAEPLFGKCTARGNLARGSAHSSQNKAPSCSSMSLSTVSQGSSQAPPPSQDDPSLIANSNVPDKAPPQVEQENVDPASNLKHGRQDIAHHESRQREKKTKILKSINRLDEIVKQKNDLSGAHFRQVAIGILKSDFENVLSEDEYVQAFSVIAKSGYAQVFVEMGPGDIREKWLRSQFIPNKDA